MRKRNASIAPEVAESRSRWRPWLASHGQSVDTVRWVRRPDGMEVPEWDEDTLRSAADGTLATPRDFKHFNFPPGTEYLADDSDTRPPVVRMDVKPPSGCETFEALLLRLSCVEDLDALTPGERLTLREGWAYYAFGDIDATRVNFYVLEKAHRAARWSVHTLAMGLPWYPYNLPIDAWPGLLASGRGRELRPCFEPMSNQASQPDAFIYRWLAEQGRLPFARCANPECPNGRVFLATGRRRHCDDRCKHRADRLERDRDREAYNDYMRTYLSEYRRGVLKRTKRTRADATPTKRLRTARTESLEGRKRRKPAKPRASLRRNSKTGRT